MKRRLDQQSRMRLSCGGFLVSLPLLLVVLVGSSGCHLMVNGTGQTVRIDTVPSGATGSFAGSNFTTPATLNLDRRHQYAVLRVSREGFAPHCELVKAKATGSYGILTALDFIPVPVLLGIDAMAGTLQPPFPESISITLEPSQVSQSSEPLHTDEEILDTWHRERHDLCKSDFDSEEDASYTSPTQIARAQQAEVARVIVTTGPISQQYEVLGSVHADTSGMVNIGSVLTDTLFRSRLATQIQATPTANNAQMNDLLRRNGIAIYGVKLGAIINVVYRVEPSGDVAADGLAVALSHTDAAPAGNAVPAAARRESNEKAPVDDRLNHLKSLVDQGLIDKEEYKRRRARILEDL